MDNIPRQVSSQQDSLQRFSLCHTLEKLDAQVHKCTEARTNYSCITTITHRNKIRKQKKYVGKHPSLSLIWGGQKKQLSGQSLSELAEHQLTFSLIQQKLQNLSQSNKACH